MAQPHHPARRRIPISWGRPWYRISSLRVRLALLHAGILAFTLITLAALTLVLLRSYLHSRADDGLLDYAETTARDIATQLYQASLTGKTELPRYLNPDLQEWGRQIQVIDRFGIIKDRSDGLRTHSIPPEMTPRLEAQKGNTYFETRYDLGEHPVRVVTVPVMMGKDVPYAVQAASSLEGIEDALNRAVLILAVLTPVVFVISLLGGWLLVSRSLRPVQEMTRTALAIEHTNLDQRIAAPATDDEISRLASAFNEMIARLDQSFRQIQQFSADASHELKTPLTAMRGEAEVALMKDMQPDEYKHVLRSIVDDVERMSAIVDNLLMLARADAEQIQVKKQTVELQEIAMDVYEQLEGIAQRKGILLDIARMDEATVEGDPLWLAQVVTNLLNNAIKYTPSGGTVTIALTVGSDLIPSANTIPNPQFPAPNAQRPTPSARLSVADTGPGIPFEHLERIFDRFYRVDSGRSRDAGGSGLGLNIAKWAAEAHGGNIEVTSEVGSGTTFTLVLPLCIDGSVVGDGGGVSR